jgi:recombination protein RecA
MSRIIEGGEFRPKFVVSSGSILLDQHLSSYGGIPSGSIVQYMSHKEGSFKTSFALRGLANIQKAGHKIGFVDAEHALDTYWAMNMGIDIRNGWYMSRPLTAEEAFEDAIKMIVDHGCKGVVFDSVDAAQPDALASSEEGSKGIDDATIGLHAKVITRGIRKLLGPVEKHDAIVIFINQMKVNLTQMGARGYKATGGNGIGFYSKLNLIMTRDSVGKLEGEDIIPVKLTIDRNKLGPSFKEIDTFAIQGYTIDEDYELVQLAKEAKLIKKNGAWWKTADGQTIGQSIEDVKDYCLQHKNTILKK